MQKCGDNNQMKFEVLFYENLKAIRFSTMRCVWIIVSVCELSVALQRFCLCLLERVDTSASYQKSAALPTPHFSK